LTELSIENDLESGLPDISAKGKQASTTQASQEASATITSLGVTTQEQRDEYEKDTLLVFDQQEQVIDPYKLSGFKFYMCHYLPKTWLICCIRLFAERSVEYHWDNYCYAVGRCAVYHFQCLAILWVAAGLCHGWIEPRA